jgi:hypothetical protein
VMTTRSVMGRLSLTCMTGGFVARARSKQAYSAAWAGSSLWAGT